MDYVCVLFYFDIKTTEIWLCCGIACVVCVRELRLATANNSPEENPFSTVHQLSPRYQQAILRNNRPVNCVMNIKPFRL